MRATAERIDDLLTDAKSALDRLMHSAAADGQTATQPGRVAAAAAPATDDLLFEDPSSGGPASDCLRLDAVDTAVGDAWSEAEPSSCDSGTMAKDQGPSPVPHHDESPTPHDDGSGVLTLAMVSMSLLILAALFGQHYAGVGIVGGANLLAWLVVVQQRRDARDEAAAAH